MQWSERNSHGITGLQSTTANLGMEVIERHMGVPRWHVKLDGLMTVHWGGASATDVTHIVFSSADVRALLGAPTWYAARRRPERLRCIFDDCMELEGGGPPEPRESRLLK
jgi:hypothetical protein